MLKARIKRYVDYYTGERGLVLFDSLSKHHHDANDRPFVLTVENYTNFVMFVGERIKQPSEQMNKLPSLYVCGYLPQTRMQKNIIHYNTSRPEGDCMPIEVILSYAGLPNSINHAYSDNGMVSIKIIGGFLLTDLKTNTCNFKVLAVNARSRVPMNALHDPTVKAEDKEFLLQTIKQYLSNYPNRYEFINMDDENDCPILINAKTSIRSLGQYHMRYIEYIQTNPNPVIVLITDNHQPCKRAQPPINSQIMNISIHEEGGTVRFMTTDDNKVPLYLTQINLKKSKILPMLNSKTVRFDPQEKKFFSEETVYNFGNIKNMVLNGTINTTTIHNGSKKVSSKKKTYWPE